MTGKETCWPLFFSLLVIYFYQLLLIIFYEKIMHFIIRTPGTYFLCFITHLLPPPYIIGSTSTKIIPLQYLLHNLSSKLISNQKAQTSFMHIMQCYTSKVKDDLGCWFFSNSWNCSWGWSENYKTWKRNQSLLWSIFNFFNYLYFVSV